MKVVFTAAALADLDEILGYTGEHYPPVVAATHLFKSIRVPDPFSRKIVSEDVTYVRE
jgi:hypothetical protein